MQHGKEEVSFANCHTHDRYLLILSDQNVIVCSNENVTINCTDYDDAFINVISVTYTKSVSPPCPAASCSSSCSSATANEAALAVVGELCQARTSCNISLSHPYLQEYTPCEDCQKQLDIRYQCALSKYSSLFKEDYPRYFQTGQTDSQMLEFSGF